MSGFTSKYNIDRVVDYEAFMDISAAIPREKQLKGWRLSKKEALIDSANPNWRERESSWDSVTLFRPDPSLTLGVTGEPWT